MQVFVPGGGLGRAAPMNTSCDAASSTVANSSSVVGSPPSEAFSGMHGPTGGPGGAVVPGGICETPRGSGAVNRQMYPCDSLQSVSTQRPPLAGSRMAHFCEPGAL